MKNTLFSRLGRSGFLSFLLLICFLIPFRAVAVGSYGVDLEDEAYTGSINPFAASYHGQCTWYCWGRAYEKLGVALSWGDGVHLGNAKDWLAGAESAGYDTGDDPRADAIFVEDWGDGIGHVAFIEEIRDGRAYYTEGNYLGLLYGGTVSDAAEGGSVVTYPPN